MSKVFCDYSRYYDLLYKDKDYTEEAAYIYGLIRKFKPYAKTILNLGCGTGRHDACLEKLGCQITGVDLSETMLAEAHKREVPGKLEFLKGDARDVDLCKAFDAVVSLFHVASYQTVDADILALFRTANKHLKNGGIFIFDFWHGGGVLNDPPVVRVKHLENDDVKITRTAEPVMHSEQNLIDVNYHIVTTDKKSGRSSEIREKHMMRYFFLTELEPFLSEAGFTIKKSLRWMSNKPLSSDWYGLIAAVKER